MGFLRSIAGGMLNMASRARNNTQLGLVFQEDPGFARLAMRTFERCLAERGLELTELVVVEARREVSKYPSLTIGQFLDAKGNANMNDALRGR
jgi:hypothetical protein